MPVRKKQSALFYDWPENMGVDVPYRDSMEGTWIDPSSSASAQCIVIVWKFIHQQTFTLYTDYKFAGRMGEGTFSEVLKCQNLVDGRMYACKKMKQKYERCVNVAERMVESLHHFTNHSLPVSLLFCLVSAVEDPGKQCIRYLLSMYLYVSERAAR